MFEYPEDVWRIIKDFAGIYQIGTEWSNIRILPLSKIFSICPFIREGMIVFLNDLSMHEIRVLRNYKTERAWKYLYNLGRQERIHQERIGVYDKIFMNAFKKLKRKK